MILELGLSEIYRIYTIKKRNEAFKIIRSTK